MASDNPKLSVNVSIDKVMHDAVADLALKLFKETGVRLLAADICWETTERLGGGEFAVLKSVRTSSIAMSGLSAEFVMENPQGSVDG